MDITSRPLGRRDFLRGSLAAAALAATGSLAACATSGTGTTSSELGPSRSGERHQPVRSGVGLDG